MPEISSKHLPDVQSTEDSRNIAIDLVGVKGVSVPVSIVSQDELQHTVAQVNMLVALPAARKGTHMSRFVQLLERRGYTVDTAQLKDFLVEMLSELDASEGRIDFAFPFFMKKKAPVSELPSLLKYDVRMSVVAKSGDMFVEQECVIPVTTLCPCSKEISKYGAHNQRSHVTIAIRTHEFIGLEEHVRFAEDNASCELWSGLKRVDEKFVTERAYENPKFVEDLVRDVAVAMNRDPRIDAYRVEAENFESIHDHSAYGRIVRGNL